MATEAAIFETRSQITIHPDPTLLQMWKKLYTCCYNVHGRNLNFVTTLYSLAITASQVGVRGAAKEIVALIEML